MKFSLFRISTHLQKRSKRQRDRRQQQHQETPDSSSIGTSSVDRANYNAGMSSNTNDDVILPHQSLSLAALFSNEQAYQNELECRIQRRRRERREWYDKFLQPYCTTVTEDNLRRLHAPTTHHNEELTNNSYRSSSCSINDINPTPTLCVSSDQQQNDISHCVFCLLDYEIGEKVVWSSLASSSSNMNPVKPPPRCCKHVFHYDCMMPWLERGKKRCPVCRQAFVPHIHIADQKKRMQQQQDMHKQQKEHEAVVCEKDQHNLQGVYATKPSGIIQDMCSTMHLNDDNKEGIDNRTRKQIIACDGSGDFSSDGETASSVAEH